MEFICSCTHLRSQHAIDLAGPSFCESNECDCKDYNGPKPEFYTNEEVKTLVEAAVLREHDSSCEQCYTHTVDLLAGYARGAGYCPRHQELVPSPCGKHNTSWWIVHDVQEGYCMTCKAEFGPGYCDGHCLLCEREKEAANA